MGSSRLRTVRYDDAVVRRLEAVLQDEYVQRYGGPDDTPLAVRDFAAPGGGFVVLWHGAEPVATGGFRRHDRVRAEIKRMFVVAGHRGHGHARVVLAELERRAAAAGYARMVLETGLRQPEALGLYTSSGYLPVPAFGRYRHSPLARHLGKDLGGDLGGDQGGDPASTRTPG